MTQKFRIINYNYPRRLVLSISKLIMLTISCVITKILIILEVVIMNRWYIPERSLAHMTDKFHMLITQHLSGNDLIHLTEVDARLNRLILNCEGCLNEIYVRFDVVDNGSDADETRYIIRTKRKYKNFRVMGYCSPVVCSFALKVLNVLGDSLLNVEVFDMISNSELEELAPTLPSMRKFKVSSFRGDYKSLFLTPQTRYEQLSFENLTQPVDVKALDDCGTASKKLAFLNAKIKDFDQFKYFNGFCTDFWFECNRKDDFDDLCFILKQTCVRELVIRKKTSNGFALKLRREVKLESKPIGELLFLRRKRPEFRQIQSPRRDLQTILTQRRSMSRHVSIDESTDDSCSLASESYSGLKETFQASLELSSLTWPIISMMSKSLHRLEKLRIFEIPDDKISEIFKSFGSLRTLIICSDSFESEFSRSMFEPVQTKDPINRLPKKCLEMFMQHFDFEDLMSSSLVSRKWNEVVSGSNSFRKKAILKLNSEKFRRNLDQIFLKSLKSFDEIEINCEDDPEFTIRALELIHAYSTMLVKLSLSDFHLERISSIKDRFIFAKLKTLNLHRVDSNSCFLLFQNSATLQSMTLSSMPFDGDIIERLRKNEVFTKLSLRDCSFDHFEKLKPENDIVDLNLSDFELIFDRANAWRIQENESFKNFLKIFSFQTIELLSVSGIRGNNLMAILTKTLVLKKLQIQHIWESDLRNNNFRKLKRFFELHAATLGIGETVNWMKHFSSPILIHIRRPAYHDVDGYDQQFKKKLKLSATKLIEMQMYRSEWKVPGYYDPIVRLPEEIHQLMFQHLNGREVLNCFEISNTWNNFCKNSSYCASKYCLSVKESFDPEVIKVLQGSTRKYENLITDIYQPKMIQNYSNLRKLSLKFHLSSDFSPVTFTSLETLIIEKCPSKLYKPEIVKKCFEEFAKCTTLKFLEIKEAITSENVESIQKMLIANKGLKTLKISACREFYRLFEKDLSTEISFKLTRLYYGVYEKFLIVGTDFEENLVKFLEKQEKIKILDFVQATASMLKVAFSIMKELEVLRFLRVPQFKGELDCRPSLRDMIIPNTSRAIARSETSYDAKPYFNAAPNLERVLLFQLNNETVDYAARKCRKLKLLAYNRPDGPDPRRLYASMKKDSSIDMNRDIALKRVKFEFVNTQERTFESMYVVEY